VAQLSPEAAALVATMLERSPGVGIRVFDAPTARRIQQERAVPRQPEPVGSVREYTVPAGDGADEPELTVRVYEPLDTGSRPRPIVTFFHGGGWVICSLDTHDPFCRKLANQSGAVVVSVDYRLAPEARFPAPAEDAYRALTWVSRNAAILGGTEDRVGVAGDSAGGNLAAAAALMARDRGGPAVAFQALAYPVMDGTLKTGSYDEFADGGGYVTRAEMAWYWDQYVDDADRGNPYASPIEADLAGLPPTMVITAECDVLRDEGVAYAEKAAAAGVPVQGRTYPGVFHGFLGAAGVLATSDEALADMSGWIRAQGGSDGAA